MATCKTVWFSESDPEKWFKECRDAERFDRAAEVVGFVNDRGIGGSGVADVVNRIMERYNIEQRYDWVEPAKDDQDETTTA